MASMASGSSLVDSLEELDSSDSGSTYEPQQNAKKKKQKTPSWPQPKKPRHNAASRGTPSSSSSIANPSPESPSPQEQARSQTRSRSIPERNTNESNKAISAKEIFDAISSGKAAIVTVVDEWLDSYKQSRERGLLVLINFIIQSCGCKGVVTREMFDSMSNAEVIGTLTKEFNETSINYPLSTPGPQMKHFKAGPGLQAHQHAPGFEGDDGDGGGGCHSLCSAANHPAANRHREKQEPSNSSL
uniref:STAG domain-containing protein n=1 Tax=Oryzias melastigma TaxID=30732 RepID=A0A3B3DNK2_ORYME